MIDEHDVGSNVARRVGEQLGSARQDLAGTPPILGNQLSVVRTVEDRKRDRSWLNQRRATRDGPAALHQVHIVTLGKTARDVVRDHEMPNASQVLRVAKNAHDL